MTPFVKPGAERSYTEMVCDAAGAALHDAGIDYAAVEQAYAGFVYADSTAGQHALYGLGMTGVPIVNVNNNCATGSTALFLARQAIASGAAECVLAVGFEQMRPGALGAVFGDVENPFAPFDAATEALVGSVDLPIALKYFGGAGLHHMQRFGTPLSTFAKVRAKASRHAAGNPLALFRRPVTAEEVLAAPALWPGVMTRLMACPPTCGAAAAVLASPRVAARLGAAGSVRILAQAMTTDRPETFERGDMRYVVGYGMARDAARQVYEAAGVGPEDLDLVELHDCFAQNEVISYEALQLCPEGGAERFVDDGDNTYGGRVVTNPSGGLLCKGHPLGATGLAQCTEIVQQLRCQAGARQVPDARLGLQHNLGLGGACVVTLYGC
jgi:acetyl-CoA acetyltransferase